MTYRVLGLMALLALIAAVVLFSEPQRSPALATAVGRTAHDPGYSALNAQLVQTGPDGKPLYTLDAAQIREQPGSDTVMLDQVQMGFRDSSGGQWTARAQRGELGQETGVVQLEGDVHVVGTLPALAAARRDLRRAPGVRHPRAGGDHARSGDLQRGRPSTRGHGPGRQLEGPSRAVRIGRTWHVPAVTRCGSR